MFSCEKFFPFSIAAYQFDFMKQFDWANDHFQLGAFIIALCSSTNQLKNEGAFVRSLC